MFEEMLWRGRCVLNIRESFITYYLAEMSEGGYVFPNQIMVSSRKRVEDITVNLSLFKAWPHLPLLEILMNNIH